MVHFPPLRTLLLALQIKVYTNLKATFDVSMLSQFSPLLVPHLTIFQACFRGSPDHPRKAPSVAPTTRELTQVSPPWTMTSLIKAKKSAFQLNAFLRQQKAKVQAIFRLSGLSVDGIRESVCFHHQDKSLAHSFILRQVFARTTSTGTLWMSSLRASTSTWTALTVCSLECVNVVQSLIKSLALSQDQSLYISGPKAMKPAKGAALRRAELVTSLTLQELVFRVSRGLADSASPLKALEIEEGSQVGFVAMKDLY